MLEMVASWAEAFIFSIIFCSLPMRSVYMCMSRMLLELCGWGGDVEY